MCLQNERVYSLLVSLENECVYSFRMYLSTHWSLQLKISGMFMRTGLQDTWVKLDVYGVGIHWSLQVNKRRHDRTSYVGLGSTR